MQQSECNKLANIDHFFLSYICHQGRNQAHIIYIVLFIVFSLGFPNFEISENIGSQLLPYITIQELNLCHIFVTGVNKYNYIGLQELLCPIQDLQDIQEQSQDWDQVCKGCWHLNPPEVVKDQSHIEISVMTIYFNVE